jgi:hypothetical protein
LASLPHSLAQLSIVLVGRSKKRIARACLVAFRHCTASCFGDTEEVTTQLHIDILMVGFGRGKQ